ncbi:MAG: 16S rRNA (cytosine(1402)-N(4))-methyltransferase RsmH [Magnetococcales bacterium]|nr:16S rRNA (cytosine(1402)-N(4))-methyltransferase RsmH [Magnetococcales bacterium]
MRQTTAEKRAPLAIPGQKHRAVLLQEVVATLAPIPGGTYVDATFGDGGHTQAILQQIGPNGRVFALDRDQTAFQRNATLLEHHAGQLTVIHTPFSQLQAVLAERGVFAVQGVLFDLGVSSRQLDEPERGFSFQADGPLDMRMDQAVDGSAPQTDRPPPRQKSPGRLTAALIVNTFDKDALADIFFHWGEERHARRIAAAIVADRQTHPFTTTRQLASLLERIMPGGHAAIHPATRVFQALRIAVNRELDELQDGLRAALDLLADGGRAVVISFHSLEDRMVKQRFRQAVDPLLPPSGPLLGPDLLVQPRPTVPCFRLLTRKPLTPGPEEIAHNPRSRSARMRAIERLTGGAKQPAGVPGPATLRQPALPCGTVL